MSTCLKCTKPSGSPHFPEKSQLNVQKQSLSVDRLAEGQGVFLCATKNEDNGLWNAWKQTAM